jgi:hypothetical protein
VARIGGDDLDLGQSARERGREIAIDLHRDDPSGVPRERRRQRAGAGSEIEHQVVTPNLRSANELRRELATAEEMPPATARLRSDGHGRPPCP